jgi:ABC-type lipoprotein release transport system permease subunit
MPARLLLRGQWRRRGGRAFWLGGSLALGLLAFFLVGMALAGAEESVVDPVRDTVAGDVRVTQGTTDMAGGAVWADVRDTLDALRPAGGTAAPRYEASHVTVRDGTQDNWTAGLLLGIDPAFAAEQEGLAGRLLWGTALPSTSLLDPQGHAFVPLVVGEPAARRLGVVGPGPDFAHPLKLSSGRFAGGSSLPITADAVVVGVYRTGLEPLDRFTAFAPIGDVRALVGGRPGDPSANAIVLHGADGADASAVASLAPGLKVEGAEAFARAYMGGLLVVLQVAGALALTLFTVVLGTWLLHDVATQLTRDAPVIAGLRG